MAIDNRVTGARLDDLILLGRPLSRDLDSARRVGLLLHLLNAVTLGALYGAFAHRRLPGPPWFRGVIYASVENSALYPLAVLDRFHPAVREDLIDRYWTRAAFVQSFPRHLAYGVVLGALCSAISDSSHRRSSEPKLDQ